MAVSLNFVCQLLLVGLICALGRFGISSTVAALGLFAFVAVMALLIAGRRFPLPSPGSRR